MKTFSIADMKKGTNYQIVKIKKFKISDLKKLTRNFKDIACVYRTKEKGVYYRTELSFGRLGILKKMRLKKYKTETYVLTVYRGKLKNFDIFNKDLVIDERREFHSIKEIVDYLDEKGYLKKKEWIAEY